MGVCGAKWRVRGSNAPATAETQIFGGEVDEGVLWRYSLTLFDSYCSPYSLSLVCCRFLSTPTMSRFFKQADDSSSDSDSEEELMSSGDEDETTATKPATAAKPAMSRFLRKTDSGSSSDSDNDSEDESEMSDEEGQKETKKKSRFLRSESEGEESDEDVKRVVKSARDKRLDEMEATGKVMDNALKINDWVAISNGRPGPLQIRD